MDRRHIIGCLALRGGAECSCAAGLATFDGYQDEAVKFDIDAPTRGLLWYYACGVAGEAGEVSDAVKKLYRELKLDTESNDPAGDLDGAVKRDLAKELGDVLWYVAVIAKMLGVRLGEVAALNVEKLESRLRRGVMFGSGDDR